MRAAVLSGFGGPDVLQLDDVERPPLKPRHVRIRVAATSVNRPDLLQRAGHYPPPPGESEVPGLECAGVIEAVADDVSGHAVGDRVCALLGGGGYAQFAAVDARHVIPIPATVSFEQAACICETYITAHMNLFGNARMTDGESALLHGGGGGVNTAAIQLIKALRPRSKVFVTASAGKRARVEQLGAHHVIDYREADFADEIRQLTDSRGVDVILDHIGAPYLGRNLKSLAIGGRLALIGIMGGRETTIDLGRLLVKRHTVVGSVLRPRSAAEKARIVSDFAADAIHLFATGAITPIIDRVVPLDQVADAHRAMEASEHFGKIVLTID